MSNSYYILLYKNKKGEESGHCVIKEIAPSKDVEMFMNDDETFGVHIYGTKRGYTLSGKSYLYSGYSRKIKVSKQWVIKEHFLGLI